ncbi:MAG: 4-hydroxy-tetrahydrodipicolinate reductase, partial [Pseudomonadota bacterium]
MRTADQPIRLSLIAPNGRMGQAIAAAVADDPGFALDQDHGDVLVDFSAPAALQASLDRAISAGVPILIGTTGL